MKNRFRKAIRKLKSRICSLEGELRRKEKLIGLANWRVSRYRNLYAKESVALDILVITYAQLCTKSTCGHDIEGS